MIAVFCPSDVTRYYVVCTKVHTTHIIPKLVRSFLFSHMAFQVEVTPSSILLLFIITVMFGHSKKKCATYSNFGLFHFFTLNHEINSFGG